FGSDRVRAASAKLPQRLAGAANLEEHVWVAITERVRVIALLIVESVGMKGIRAPHALPARVDGGIEQHDLRDVALRIAFQEIARLVSSLCNPRQARHFSVRENRQVMVAVR